MLQLPPDLMRQDRNPDIGAENDPLDLAGPLLVPPISRSYIAQLLAKLQGARSNRREAVFIDPVINRDLAKIFHKCLLGSTSDEGGLSIRSRSDYDALHLIPSTYNWVLGPARVGKTTLHRRQESFQREAAHGFFNNIPYRQKPLGLLVDGTVQPAAARLDT